MRLGNAFGSVKIPGVKRLNADLDFEQNRPGEERTHVDEQPEPWIHQRMAVGHVAYWTNLGQYRQRYVTVFETCFFVDFCV